MKKKIYTDGMGGFIARQILKNEELDYDSTFNGVPYIHHQIKLYHNEKNEIIGIIDIPDLTSYRPEICKQSQEDLEPELLLFGEKAINMLRTGNLFWN